MGKKIRPKKRKSQPLVFRFAHMGSVVLLLHQQAPNWGLQHQLDTLYEIEPEFCADKNGLPRELSRFTAGGGRLNDLAWSAVNRFAPVGRIDEPTRKTLFAHLRKELGKMLDDYRGGRL